ncbi:MAG: DUF438 domain-containing protein [Acidobacteria bacterium]|nr:DUF438 domain-containing protein [Acidobacteriota bacterium]
MSELIDNRAQRIRTLKSIIEELHAGAPAGQVKARLRELVRQTDYSEIFSMEQELIAGGMPASEVQGMCDLHSQVTRDVLVQLPIKTLPPGHPIDTLRRENEALREAIKRFNAHMCDVLGDGGEPAIIAMRQSLNELMDVDKHYQRKEHLLFTCLERHGFTGPSKVMWGKDDEVRDQLKDLSASLHAASVEEAKLLAATAGEALSRAIDEMIYKEENILFKVSLDLFTEDEWAEIWTASPRYGWCLVEPRQGYRPPAPSIANASPIAADDAVALPSGRLSVKQLTALFSALPVDLTFVDADDRVAFFSEGPDRIFARSKAILGRKVQHCHPPKSVDIVDRILGDFRAGRQSVAAFWIEFGGRMVHIRYFAVRGEDGAYMGTLEVTQNVTPIRELTGERRLLEYDAAEAR